MKRKKERKQGEQVDEGNYRMVVHMVDWFKFVWILLLDVEAVGLVGLGG